MKSPLGLIALSLVAVARCNQIVLAPQYSYELLDVTISTSGWERSSAIVTGPARVVSDTVYRNTTWSIDLPNHLRDLVKSAAPFDWIDASDTGDIEYGITIDSGVTGYIAQTTMWHIMVGYIRDSLKPDGSGDILLTVVVPKTLSNGSLDGSVTFIPIN
ncbi:hypothetical protein EDD11_009564 [Mortierella claussenii]|nr:hypothetical protein EDD11_009564 [Mortierella claussenii]